MILLASRSPQRRALLGALGVEFRVVVSGVVEGADPVANARAKAEDVAARATPALGAGDAVIGADTEVLLDGRALGKAADRGRRRRCSAPCPAAFIRSCPRCSFARRAEGARWWTRPG